MAVWNTNLEEKTVNIIGKKIRVFLMKIKKYKEVPPETSEVKLKKSRRTFSFTTLFGIEEKWMVGTIKLKVINSFSNTRKTKNKNSPAYYDDFNINNELEFLNGTKSAKEDILKTIWKQEK